MLTHPSKYLHVVLFSLWMAVAVGGSSSSTYLKEILLGRCYDLPPTTTGHPELCPGVVDSFVNLLESHWDASLSVDDFRGYFDDYQVDFSAAAAKGMPLIWLQFEGTAAATTTKKDKRMRFVPPPTAVTPETTLAGIMFGGDLVFCGLGMDHDLDNCQKETSRAYWQFWQAAYSEFAASLGGDNGDDNENPLAIVVEPFADVQFLERSVVPVLSPNITVTLYPSASNDTNNNGGCASPGLQRLLQALQQTNHTVTCREDVWELWRNSFRDEDDDNDDDDHHHDHDHDHDHAHGRKKNETTVSPPAVAEEKSVSVSREDNPQQAQGGQQDPQPPPIHWSPLWAVMVFASIVVYCWSNSTAKEPKPAGANGKHGEEDTATNVANEKYPLLVEVKKHGSMDSDDDTDSSSGTTTDLSV